MLRLYKAINVANTNENEINNIILKLSDFKDKEGMVKIKLISTSDMFDDFVVKKTVIVSDYPEQLKRNYSVENPCLLRNSTLKHEITNIQDRHGREDTIQDKYNYIFDGKTTIKVDKLLPKSSFSIYIYLSKREIFPNFFNNAEVALHSIDLLR